MPPPLKLVWSTRALRSLARLAERLPGPAAAVVEEMERTAQLGWSTGRRTGLRSQRYLPIPPLGVFYQARNGELLVNRVVDGRRLRRLP